MVVERTSFALNLLRTKFALMTTKQIAFLIVFGLLIALFSWTVSRLMRKFSITRKNFPLDQIPERIKITLQVAFGQTKILRRPVLGFMHALVWWGFIVITIGTAEMIIDGFLGTERVLSFLGPAYSFIVASGDIFAAIILVMCLMFLFRRLFMRVKRFEGVEMTKKAKLDAGFALFLIIILMVSLIGMNMGYVASGGEHGLYPVAEGLIPMLKSWSASAIHGFHETNWWIHIIAVLVFLNVLPYSKHFHVIMSVPNVFFTRLGPITKIANMPAVTKEVELLMNPATAYAEPPAGEAATLERFGIKDVEDISWKNYADSLTCTQCGRCTDACPQNITGKLLSPRKILVETRKRMDAVGLEKAKDKDFTDGKSLIHEDYISEEEIWACNTCNACVQECPVNIDHVSIIMDLRRNLVMEESKMPAALAQMLTNIENNGAPWQYSAEDRLKWAEGLTINS